MVKCSKAQVGRTVEWITPPHHGSKIVLTTTMRCMHRSCFQNYTMDRGETIP